MVWLGSPEQQIGVMHTALRVLSKESLPNCMTTTECPDYQLSADFRVAAALRGEWAQA